MKAKTCSRLFAALGVLLISPLTAAPPPLPPGGSQTLNGATSVTFPESRGQVIRDVLIPFAIRNPFDNAVLITGSLQDRVSRNDDGHLVFSPRLRNLVNPGGVTWIFGVRLHGYGGVNVSTEFSTDGSGQIGPNSVQRSAGGGETLYYSHGSRIIVPPDEQRFVHILTDETEFSLNGKVEIFASNDFGGTSFKTTLEGTASPTPFHEIAPGDSIQAAIDLAHPGQTISVSAGTYPENLVMRDDVSVRGEDPCTTIITGSGVVVRFPSVTGVTFSGFTVTGGTTGLAVAGGSPVIENNKVHGNTTGIDVDSGSTAVLCGNRIYDNSGTGLEIAKASPLVTNNRIYQNARGITLNAAASSGSRIINNTIARNTGDGIAVANCAPFLKNNLIVSNISAGIRLAPAGTLDVSYHNVRGNGVNYVGFTPSGPGNLTLDPLFDPADPDEFLLLPGSPCLDAGDPAELYHDLDGSRNDIGATGGPCSATGPSGSGRENGFIFTSVGTIPTSAISEGLADFGSFHDAPFGGTLWLFGGFGYDDNDVREYSVHIGQWDGASPPEAADFVPLDDPLRKVRWTRVGGTYSPVTVTVGPEEVGGIPYYERTENGGGTIWAHENVMIKWNTGDRVGKYDVELRAYDAARNRLPLDDNRLTLVIDNTEAVAKITSLALVTGAVIPECAIIRLGDKDQKLRFGFTASHANGYLHSYSLEALVGRDRSAGVLASDRYLGMHDTPGPLWSGPGATSVDAAPADGWETCAYQFRLTAHRRTTNGFSRLPGAESFANYALDLDSGVCSPDLDGDGDVDAADLAIFAAAFGR